VRLDNRDNPITGPKPLAQLDFNMYHGLYRPVHLITKGPLHITDPLLADRPASGGVFVTYFRVRVTLRALDGDVAASATSPPVTLVAGADTAVTQDLEVTSPRLWSPATPDLYTLDTEVVTDAGTVDAEAARIGIRRIGISGDGFSINGERMFLRGANRHQEYPYIGYALSDAAQYRDARKIKEAGFDYVRLSHYAHAPAFMDACDELGRLAVPELPRPRPARPQPSVRDPLGGLAQRIGHAAGVRGPGPRHRAPGVSRGPVLHGRLGARLRRVPRRAAAWWLPP
jgi:beta-galactosidase